MVGESGRNSQKPLTTFIGRQATQGSPNNGHLAESKRDIDRVPNLSQSHLILGYTAPLVFRWRYS